MEPQRRNKNCRLLVVEFFNRVNRSIGLLQGNRIGDFLIISIRADGCQYQMTNGNWWYSIHFKWTRTLKSKALGSFFFCFLGAGTSKT
jgi:hypothetical protein